MSVCSPVCSDVLKADSGQLNQPVSVCSPVGSDVLKAEAWYSSTPDLDLIGRIQVLMGANDDRGPPIVPVPAPPPPVYPSAPPYRPGIQGGVMDMEAFVTDMKGYWPIASSPAARCVLYHRVNIRFADVSLLSDHVLGAGKRPTTSSWACCLS